MGTDYTVYVGPHAVCKNSMADKEKSRRSCINSQCKNHREEYWDMNTKFCPLCGNAVGTVKFVAKATKVDTDPCLVNEKMAPYHIQHKNVDSNTDIWIGNESRKGKRSFSFSPKYDGEQYQELTPEIIAADIAEFTEQYEKPLAKLRELYGDGNVTIKWGLIHEIN